MISLDTNIVLRFLLNDVPIQSRKATSLITRNQVYVTDVTITETVYVLQRTMGVERSRIVSLLKELLRVDTVVTNDYFLEEAIDLYGIQPSLSFVDCYSAAEAEAYGNGLVTFDKKLVKHGGQHVSEPL